VNQILGDEDLTLALREALEDVPELLDEAGGLLAGLRRVASEAEENLANLRGLTGPLGQQGGEIVGKLDQGAERLDELLQQLVQFSRSLNSSEGSLGQFVNNPELYQKLSSAATNIEQVSRRLEPIVDDARHFMDKVARDPRLLGVR
jgi:phospholipid/cholesterol/gamma-HCH transport system substrate-binding protein